MKIYDWDITMSEVPDHISLTISVCGCELKCNGCSWLDYNEADKKEFNIKIFEKLLSKYKDMISCVCFLGGEWEEDFLDYLKLSKEHGLSNCLYTGKQLLSISKQLRNKLDYIKVGRWVEELGGLKEKTTNQRFIEIETNKILNEKFRREI